MEETVQPERSRISRIHVERVFNLGNYENVRYGFTLEVGSQDDPGKLLCSLETIVNDLHAKSGVASWDLHNARQLLERPEAELEDYERERLPAAREKIARHEEAIQRQVAARAALATLDYTRDYRDAKETWDEDDL